MPTSSSSTRSTCRAPLRSKPKCASSAIFAWASAASVALFCVGCAAGCNTTSSDPPDAATSPQAKAEPAPLAALPTPGGTATMTTAADAGPSPESLRSDTPLVTDVPHEIVRELVTRDGGSREVLRDPRELAGYQLTATVHTGEGPPAPKAPEVNTNAIEAARHKTEEHLAIEVSQTRARFVMSGGFVLPTGTELRARADRYGHLLLWPGEDSYRVVEPGALRALLGERRLDVAPLSPAQVASSGEGPRRLNLRTRRIEVKTRAATATMEVGAFRDAGDGGVLVCRMLLDLMDAPPGTAACATDEVPLHAEIRWTTEGSLVFDVTAVARRIDLPAQELAAPPSSSTFVADPPPLPPADTLLARTELAALRNGPIDLPPAGSHDAGPPPPEAGLLLVNATDELRVAWLDGVPVAWVAPGGRELLPSLVRGRYTLQWRTALGDGWTTPSTVTLPHTSEIGAPDAPAL